MVPNERRDVYAGRGNSDGAVSTSGSPRWENMPRHASCLLAACLGVVAASGCGRTPVNVFLTDARSEETEIDPLENGCTKVDYLFVVDNSSSMADNQSKLAAGVHGFLQGVASVVDEVDSVHAGVITTDAYDHNTADCQRLGALVSRTGGHNSSDMDCGPFADGGRFLSEQDDIAAGLECLIKVGTTGSTNERPLHAVRHLVDPNGSVAACNEGFLRPDALLVLVFITDEDALAGTGTYEALVDAKGGHDDAIVVVTIAHGEEGTCRPSGHARTASNLLAFTHEFEHGLAESICSGTYQASFERAAEVVKNACGS